MKERALNPSSKSDNAATASHALLVAAIGGLLCMAACGGEKTSSSGSGATGSKGDAGGSTSVNPDSSPTAFECDGGVAADPQVTSSTVGAVTQDDFAAKCAGANGVFEIQPHCGGSNNCRGFSYDSNTETFTDHTCRATNTCAGYSCVVCD